jgi:RHS repeat-associated protein
VALTRVELERAMIRRYAVAVVMSLTAAASMIGGISLRAGQGASAAVPAASPVAAGQTRTELADGRWLVVGGEGTEARAWLWNPVTNVTSALVLQMPRSWHTATVLPDGTVLIANGRQGAGYASAPELFDPGTQTFSPLTIEAAVPRAEHTATLLIDGRVLVAGGTSGDGGPLAAEIWDLRTHTASILGDPAGALGRVRHNATLLPDGRVELSGGRQIDGTPARDTVIVDPIGRAVVRSGPPLEDAGVPVLVEALPANGAIDVSPDTYLALRFSSALRRDALTSEVLTLSGPEGVVTTQVISGEGGRLLFVWPAHALAGGATYTLAVSGAVELRGVPAPPVLVSFTTSASSETTNPVVDTEAWFPDPNAARNGWRMNRPPSPWESLAPLTAVPGVTAIAGRVLTLDGRPLSDVSLEVEGDAETRSDRSGRFLLVLKSPASGRRVLRIDGAPASRPTRRYGFFEYGFTVDGGTTNVLPFTIWMPKLDVAHQVTIASPTTGEVVVKTPYIPGLELHLPAGTTITGEDGAAVTTLTLTPVPVDRPPFPLAANIDVPVYFTIQPGGAYVHVASAGPKGAWLVYPNYRQGVPGQRVQFFHYDPDVKGWYVYGVGTVTADGSQVKPDPKTRIYSFTGAMINVSGNSPPRIGPDPGSKPRADPVDPSTGVFVLQQPDLYLPDLIPLALTRVYNSGDDLSRPFGRGMTHPYAMFLWSAQQYQQADLILPDGGTIHYVRTSAGTGFTDAEFMHVERPNDTPPTVATPTRFYKSTLVWNGNGWNLTLKDGTVYVFGENAPLQAIRDRYGNTITITHASGQSGNVTRVTSPSGRSIAFTYDASNHITQATDNLRRTVLYTYHPTTGNLLTVTDPENNVTTYTWDAGNRLATIKDGRNIVYLTNHYDASGRIDRQTLADPDASYTFAYTADANGNITQTDITNPRSYTERLTFNSSHALLSDTEALGEDEERTTTYERQAGNNLLNAVVDGLNRRTEYLFDDFGHITQVKQLAGTLDEARTTYTYEPLYFQLATITDPLLHQWTIGYDANGRVTSATDPLNHRASIGMNALGQITSIADPLGHLWQAGYTGPDQTSVTNPLGSVWRSVMDGGSRVLWTTDPLGRVTQLTPDKLNRVRTITDPAGGQTQIGYDPNGGLLSLTDALNHATSYTYDSSDRMDTRTDPLQAIASYGYDKKDNVTSLTDRKSQVTNYQYDPLDRLTLATYADTSTTAYTYDAGGRVRQIVDSNAGTITRDYDGFDRLTSEVTPQGTVSYTYDEDGRRATTTVAGQPPVVYGYDDAHRMSSITQGTSIVSITYDDAGRRSTVTMPNGVVTTYGYDNSNALVSLTYTRGQTLLGNLTYTFDAVGNRTSVGGSWARTALPVALGNATYDAANRIQTWAGQSYSYDVNGNLENDGVTTYLWNARDQLSGLSGGASASFAYDGLGRRRHKTVAGTTTQSLYDGVNLVQEQSSGGTPTANLLIGLGIDETFVRSDATGTSALLVDAMGSTVELADASGALQAHYTFEPFGATTASGSPSPSTLQFTGRENDGTGLYYYRARYYSPLLKGFVSEDPLDFAGGHSNLYTYAFNNPTAFRDPDGTHPVWIIVAAGVVLVVVVGEEVMRFYCNVRKCEPPEQQPHTHPEETRVPGNEPYNGPRPPGRPEEPPPPRPSKVPPPGGPRPFPPRPPVRF